MSLLNIIHSSKIVVLILLISQIPSTITPATFHSTPASQQYSQVTTPYQITPFSRIDVEQEYPNIAFVQPTFTAAAYSGFYDCYKEPRQNASDCFVRPEINSWTTSDDAYGYIRRTIKEGYPLNNVHIIKDSDVHKGLILDSQGMPVYSSILFFHSEYVSIPEYNNVVKYMKAGGNVIILSGNAFYAEVDYNETTKLVRLVSGHKWNFDGLNQTENNVYGSIFRDGQYSFENWGYFGSEYTNPPSGRINYAKLNTNSSNPHPISLELQYQGITEFGHQLLSHEEDSLITSNAHIIADWKTAFSQTYRGIKIFEIFPEGPYGGSLINFGIYASTHLLYHSGLREAVLTAIRYQAGYYVVPWIKYPMDNAVLNNNIILQYTLGWDTSVFINHRFYPNLKTGDSLDFLPEGEYNLTIQFSLDETLQISKSIQFTIDRTPPDFIFNNNTRFNIPPDYPNTKLNITLRDTNPEYLRVSVYNYMTLSSQFTTNISTVSLNLDYDLNNTKWVSIEGMDSAGNWNSKWVSTYSTKSNLPSKNSIPHLEKVTENTIKVTIDTPEPDTIATLQISGNYGKTWTNINFNETDLLNQTISAYFSRITSHFWYRICYSSSTLLFYSNVKSYYWDDTIYCVESTSLKVNNLHNSNQYVVIRKSQIQESKIDVVWMDRFDNVVLTSSWGYSSAIWDNITFRIPTLPSGYYKMILKIQNSNQTVGLPFPFFIDHGIFSPEVKNFVGISNLVSIARDNFTDLEYQNYNMLIWDNSLHHVRELISSQGLNQTKIALNSYFTDIVVYIYDDMGTIYDIFHILGRFESHFSILVPNYGYDLLFPTGSPYETSDSNAHIYKNSVFRFVVKKIY